MSLVVTDLYLPISDPEEQSGLQQMFEDEQGGTYSRALEGLQDLQVVEWVVWVVVWLTNRVG